MTLLEAQVGEEYIIKDIVTDDEEMDAFLFTLGCYSGEPITVVSRKKGGCVVSIKDGRYNIDNLLAEAITVQYRRLYIYVAEIGIVSAKLHIFFAEELVLTILGQNYMTQFTKDL